MTICPHTGKAGCRADALAAEVERLKRRLAEMEWAADELATDWMEMNQLHAQALSDWAEANEAEEKLAAEVARVRDRVPMVPHAVLVEWVKSWESAIAKLEVAEAENARLKGKLDARVSNGRGPRRPRGAAERM